MNKKIIYVVSAILLVVLLGGMVMVLKKNKRIAEERVFRYEKRELPYGQVPVDSANQVKIPEEPTFTGVFEASRETKISAETSGKIVSLYVDAGSRVARGQTLIQLDQSLLKLQLQSVDLQIEGLSADVRRYTILAGAEAIQAVQLEKAQLGFKSAQVQRETILEQIRKTAIRAPFDGVVLTKLTEVGAFAAPGVPLLHLLDVDQMKFTVYVPEADLKKFMMGETYPVIADAFPDRILQGKLIHMSSKANTGNSFMIQFKVSNFSGGGLRAGMFGKLALPLHK